MDSFKMKSISETSQSYTTMRCLDLPNWIITKPFFTQIIEDKISTRVTHVKLERTVTYLMTFN